MIKNDRQLALTKTRLCELEARLVRLREQHRDAHDYDFYAEATRDTVASMKREIREYRLVKTASVVEILRIWGTRGSVSPTRKTDLSLGELIAMLRMARGMTQEQLAARLGLRQAHVARYEQRGYRRYTVETLARIFSVLGVRLCVEPVSQSTAA